MIIKEQEEIVGHKGNGTGNYNVCQARKENKNDLHKRQQNLRSLTLRQRSDSAISRQDKTLNGEAAQILPELRALFDLRE